MKKFLLTLLVAVSTMSFAVSEVQAKRMGSGGSFGKQSQSFKKPAPTQQSATNTAKPATPAAAPASPWRGILGGALLGLGLGALLSHLGLGGAMASMISTMLMIALFAGVAFFIYRMWQRRNGQSGMKPAFAGAYQKSQTPEIGAGLNHQSQPAALQANSTSFGAAPGNEAVMDIPADFDVPAFLRNAKTYYIRLQAAWDRADVNDIREFTSPELFGELKLQLQERGASTNYTDVVTLDAELLGIETMGNDYLVSVKFAGLIRETENAVAEPFAEIWNLSKPVSGPGGWTLAGIQQVAETDK